MSIQNLKKVEVVAAVIESSGTILCVQRGLSKLNYISEKWEFPGGKIQDGESQNDALIREISEELQVLIAVDSKLITINHWYPDFHLTMHTYKCRLLSDKKSIVLTEHKNLAWLKPLDPEFKQLDWAAADVPIVNRICENK